MLHARATLPCVQPNGKSPNVCHIYNTTPMKYMLVCRSQTVFVMSGRLTFIDVLYCNVSATDPRRKTGRTTLYDGAYYTPDQNARVSKKLTTRYEIEGLSTPCAFRYSYYQCLNNNVATLLGVDNLSTQYVACRFIRGPQIMLCYARICGRRGVQRPLV